MANLIVCPCCGSVVDEKKIKLPSKLTGLEEKMLQFIGHYIRSSDGRSPTLAEIGKACGVKSSGTVHRYLKSLESKGVISRSGRRWGVIQPITLAETVEELQAVTKEYDIKFDLDEMRDLRSD